MALSPDMTCGVPVTSCQRTMSAFQAQYASPLVWVTRLCTVTRLPGGRSTGV